MNTTNHDNTQPATFAEWIAKAYRQPQDSYTMHNMEVAFTAGAAAVAPLVLPEWEKVRRGLTMVMLGLAGRPDCTETAIEAALDAVTEPGMPLAALRMLSGAQGKQEAHDDAMDWDQLPEDPSERAMFDRNLELLYGGDPRIPIATSLRIWANTRGNGSFGLMCAILANEVAKLHIAPQAQADDFQQRVQPWMMACFGPEISADRIERNHRFLEEALELVQSLGCTASEAHQLVDYVFGRPVGDPMQEAGGVMVTLAALCLASGLDMHACGETELTRIWTMVEAIRAKQAAKPKHSPLPMHAPQTQDALRLAFVLSEIRRDGMDALGAALHDTDGFPLDHKASLEAIDRAANAAASGK